MHSAHDRDRFVEIIWKNINSTYTEDFWSFNESEVSHFNESYDYESIMHYGRDAFSVNGEPTIVPKVIV